jgi:predicted nucleic acid-binding protein
MKRVTLDLNVLLDFLNKRASHQEAAVIVDLCVRKKLKGYLCAHEFTTLAYFLHKEHKEAGKIKHVLTWILEVFSILPVHDAILRESLNSPIKDFEDAVIEVSSMTNKVDYIITRNMGDFKASRVKSLTPAEFLQLVQEM